MMNFEMSLKISLFNIFSFFLEALKRLYSFNLQ